LLVSGFPATGAGSMNMYEIYGNYFLHNHHEALFQGSGRISLHDNVFVDGPYSYPAVVLRKHNNPLKVALVYNNTIYTSGKGIYFGSRAQTFDAVVGNLVFGSLPISGQIIQKSNNLVDSLSNAPAYVKLPALTGPMDFYPLPGKCQGGPVDLSDFDADADYSVDFNGTPKVSAKGATVYRGAYAGEGSNAGWPLQAGVKVPVPPPPNRPATLVWLAPASRIDGQPHVDRRQFSAERNGWNQRSRRGSEQRKDRRPDADYCVPQDRGRGDGRRAQRHRHYAFRQQQRREFPDQRAEVRREATNSGLF
jgi:hypothetical protein